jgi:hypothetical protein
MIDRAEDVFEERPVPTMLHILNGDSTRGSLEQSGVPGTMATWADVLHDGQVPPFDVGADRWRQVRAQFIADQGWASYEDALATFRKWDAAIDRYSEYDEAVIWCEHDLFDQLLLIRHLAWFAAHDLGRTALALICIGEWPGRPHFKGLGELAPSDLASLVGTRQRVSQRQLELGRRAWRAFTGDDPRAIEQLIQEEDTSSLPFLAGALRRLLEEFPSVRDGLVRTDRQLLELIAQGKTQLTDLFVANHALESNYFIGDSSFIVRLRRLARGLDALVRLDEGSDQWWKTGTVQLMGQGRAVLAGRGNWVRLAGIDEWRGGVHLQGNDAEWRWDADAQRLRGRGGADDVRSSGARGAG